MEMSAQSMSQSIEVQERTFHGDALTVAILHDFRDTLALKYRVSDMGCPKTYLRWTISRTGLGKIHAA